jgi:isoquinoline 1-oxidoreductase subunit beta
MKPQSAIEETIIRKIDRRSFLKATGLTATGVILGLQMQCSPKKVGAPFSPNVYLTINGDGSVVIVAHRQEMGTGIRTNLPLVIADELEADWSKVKVVQAVGDEPKYGDQNTDGSYSVRMFFEPMRKAGASARLMLEKAAASKWGVSVSECKAVNHEVVNQLNGKKLAFEELTDIASKLVVPKDEEIKLKDKADWKYIGKTTGTYDAPFIANGTAIYGMDTKVDGMKYAVIARSPVIGGKVKSFNADKAKAVAGVVKVVEVPASPFPAGIDVPMGGIAIIADNTWAAISARKELEIEWDLGEHADYDTEAYINDMKARVKKKGKVRRANGNNIDKAMAGAAKVLESTYVIPHLSHAPMETPNALAVVKDNKCEVWAPVQSPHSARKALANFLSFKLEDVTVNVPLLGGAFGRKSKPDFALEAAWLSKENGTPVKVIWTREDDLANDFFHACSVQHIRVAFDNQKKVTGWNHRSVFPSIGGTFSLAAVEPSADELGLGMVDFPFNIPAIQCETHESKVKTRIGWLRSVCNIQHAFAIGSMLDEVAEYRKVDPVDNLIELLGEDREIHFNDWMKDFFNYNEPLDKFPCNTKRFREVIELVRDKSGWGKPLPKGHGMGICAHKSFLTYVACVVHVAVDDEGKISIPELHYAVDCGIPVNRNSVINQFEGGAVFALSGAMKGGITFKDGRSQETNFDKYGVMRMSDAPTEIFVHLVENDEKPTGVGEPPVPPVAPALANAIFAATGKRVRELPVKLT